MTDTILREERDMTEVDTSRDAVRQLLEDLRWEGSQRKDSGCCDLQTVKVLARAHTMVEALQAELSDWKASYYGDTKRLEAERDAAQMDADMQAREVNNMVYNARVLMADLNTARSLLTRWLRVADSGIWRDVSELSLAMHPVADDTRAALTQKPYTDKGN